MTQAVTVAIMDHYNGPAVSLARLAEFRWPRLEILYYGEL